MQNFSIQKDEKMVAHVIFIGIITYNTIYDRSLKILILKLINFQVVLIDFIHSSNFKFAILNKLYNLLSLLLSCSILFNINKYTIHFIKNLLFFLQKKK